ncbi:Protein mlp1, partial [Cryomyces antarcticus]
MLKGENSELQKRSQTLAENAAKQDLRTQQVAEELVETKGLADSMRKENANLKAERELWKNIEGRLSEDNRSLMDDRSRLHKMIGDLQSLQNERELSESESRRRLQSRAEALEAELQTTKQKLDIEVEEGKNAVLRREYESYQNRTRIDDLVRSLGNAREELVAAKTTRDQLQARVDEMKIELRSAEERAQVSQPRRISGGATLEEATDRAVNGGEALDTEQRLTVEVSELRRDLELTRGELESAKAHVEQYKEISQSSEEELQSLNDTHDQYRAEMDRVVSEKDEEITELKQRLADLSSELTATNTELSNLRTKEKEGNLRLAEQNTVFEAEVARLKDESERYAETSKLYQEDLKAQAEIAQQAQQNYEDELVKHADAAKALHK